MKATVGILVMAVVLAALPSTSNAQRHVHHHRHYRRPAPPPLPPPPPPARAMSPADEDLYLLGIGLRVSGIALEGTKLNLSDIENPVMGGVGVQFRAKVARHWGLELAVDYLRADPEDFTQVSIPLTLNAMFHFFPDSRIDLYALAGIGAIFTSLEFENGLYKHDLIEIVGDAGLGLQVKLTRSFALHLDLRFLGVFKNLDDRDSIREDCLRSSGDRVGFCNNLARYDPDDRFNIGLQFQLGATYFF